MKIIALLACFLVFGAVSAHTKHHPYHPLAHRQQKIELAGAVQKLINDFIQGLSDPLDKSEGSLSALGYTVAYKDLHVDGIHSLSVQVSVDVLFNIKVKIGFTIKELNASVGHWESDLPIVNGNGKAGITLKDVAASVDVQLSLLAKPEPSKVSISVGSADFIITGVQNDDALSQSITDKVNHVLNVLANDAAVHAQIQVYIDLLLSIILTQN